MNNRYTFWITIILVLLGAVLVVHAEFTKVSNIPKTPKMEIVCLSGVAYWKLGNFNHGRLAPKYSPGNSIPDSCE